MGGHVEESSRAITESALDLCNHPTPQTVAGVEMNPQAAGAGVQGTHGMGRDSKEKVKSDGRMFPGFASDFVKKRRDDDTLREVGNVMPEYDCDKDDPQPKQVDKTQDSVKRITSAEVALTQDS